jgi:hypothetical protein
MIDLPDSGYHQRHSISWISAAELCLVSGTQYQHHVPKLQPSAPQPFHPGRLRPDRVYRNPLDLVEGDLVGAAVVELRRPR